MENGESCRLGRRNHLYGIIRERDKVGLSPQPTHSHIEVALSLRDSVLSNVQDAYPATRLDKQAVPPVGNPENGTGTIWIHAGEHRIGRRRDWRLAEPVPFLLDLFNRKLVRRSLGEAGSKIVNRLSSPNPSGLR